MPIHVQTASVYSAVCNVDASNARSKTRFYPYHLTNSSPVIGHFLHVLCSLHYMCCVACGWKPRLMPAVIWRRMLSGPSTNQTIRVLEGTAVSCRRLSVYPRLSNDCSWDNYRLCIVVECTACWPIVWSVLSRNAHMIRVFVLNIVWSLCFAIS